MTYLHKMGIIAVCLAAFGGAGCSSSDEDDGAPSGSQPSVSKEANLEQKQAPQLAALVAEGKLPSLAERLPANPRVIQPIERMGKYGGTWRMGLRGGGDHPFLARVVGYENLVVWDRDWKEIIPNVAESFEVSDDAREFTFKLREGLRWSDGAPYSADDIVFWWEDVFMNDELTPVKHPWFSSGGRPVMVKKIDQYTVKFRFQVPNGLFLRRLASGEGDMPIRYPRHYLKRFHKKYNPDIDRLVKEANVPDWVTLFRNKGESIPGTPYDARWNTTGLPTLYPWVITTPYGGATRVVLERNPYYWKVDPAGRQLPYIDRLVFSVGDDVETLVLKALNGEIDMQHRHIGGAVNKPLFVDNMERGGYRFYETIGSGNNSMVISLNLTDKDPVKRATFQNKDFRIGLSHAINRQEIIDLIFVGLGHPYQVGPRPESPHYHQRLATQYLEYDVDRANAYLDKAGFIKRDEDGFRLGPDGKRISFSLEVASTQQTRVDALELVKRYWAAVGIEMNVKAEDRSLLYARKEANEHDAVLWGGAGGIEVLEEPRWYFPFSIESNYAIPWAFWYNRDPRGEEPPEIVKKQMRLYDEIKRTVDPEKQRRLMRQILDIAADQFYVIGVSMSRSAGYGIVKNNFRNVPKEMYTSGGVYHEPGPTNPEQYFFDR